MTPVRACAVQSHGRPRPSFDARRYNLDPKMLIKQKDFGEAVPRLEGYYPVQCIHQWINLLLLSSSGPVKIPVGAWYVFFLTYCRITNIALSATALNHSKSLATAFCLAKPKS